MSTSVLTSSPCTERETQLRDLRQLASHLGLVLDGGQRRFVYRTLQHLGQVVSIRVSDAPAIKPEINAIREVYPILLHAIDTKELYEVRDLISHMLDLAGLY